MMESGYSENGGDVKIFLYIQANAKKTECVGLHNGWLKIRLAALPIENKANQLLITWLAEKLFIPRSQLILIAGKTSKRKTILIKNITALKIKTLLFDSKKM